MDKKVKTLNESQLCDLITNITKQYIMEAMELHPEFGEVGEKPYGETRSFQSRTFVFYGTKVVYLKDFRKVSLLSKANTKRIKAYS